MPAEPARRRAAPPAIRDKALAARFPALTSGPAAGPAAEVRALPVFNHIPPGCTVHRQPDDRQWPHVREGERVIVDCTDREIVLGELFLIAQRGGPALWLLRRDPWEDGGASPAEATVYLGNLNTPRTAAEAGRIGTGTIWAADGPIYRRALEPLVIGRCIGLFAEPPFNPPAPASSGRAQP